MIGRAAPLRRVPVQPLAYSNFRPLPLARPPQASALDASLAPPPTSSASIRKAVQLPRLRLPAIKYGARVSPRCAANSLLAERPATRSAGRAAELREISPSWLHQSSSQFSQSARSAARVRAR